ncbi:MAG: sensor histidine kinase [Chloroflexota bacterium]|jgi:signal transduction histidine kinase
MAELLRSAPVDEELSQRVYWFTQLRWLAAFTVIVGSFVATNFLGIKIDPLPLYLIGAAIALYNFQFLAGIKRAEVGPKESRLTSARSIANTQIVVDLFFLTLLIHFTGGVENPLSFFFIFHVIIASILLSPRETFLQATVAILLFGGLALGEYAGIIPHVHLFGPTWPDMSSHGLYVAIVLLVFSSTLYLAAYMATSITGRLREREKETIELTEKLGLKAKELEEAYNHLAELERIKSEHLGKVSFEIKPPLATIQTSLKIVLDSLVGEKPAVRKDMIQRAEGQTQRLLNFASDLLVLSRAREARLFTERKPIDLLEIVQKVVTHYKPQAEAKSITLSVQFLEQPPCLYADPEALEQVVMNLVGNAVVYTLEGGRVDVKVDELGNAARLVVKDTGIGIAAADLPKVYNEFYRAENARRFNEEGTGLGLSIVRGIVETLGGEIEVESQVGQGTTFTVLLPGGPLPCR